ncbi:MAG: aspartyl-tRNA(Asn)/glutamyl-tRNA (Gln) amidotransferase subunit C [Ignavibacteria bacterium]|nr:MAG: aspartyl-tRNA(Asn)/glutamyl-tRNA (Gln) amidotransferase subunit C [Ignavibacteria bacterium]KAF0159850.1 MAG: aspartyl-tRNA(Asn)/glutamyl-tRNA (Gln) amidotransferase subunit C [Ignavibacteria bacterium]
MSVTQKDVEYIALLAKLKFEQTELDNFTHHLNDILAYVEKLNELDTESIEPLSHPVENSNVFREDELKHSISTEESLKNAPDKTEEFFRVPKVINQ